MAREIDCIVCRRSETRPLFRVRDEILRRPGEFFLVHCPRCDLAFLNPQPTPKELEGYYPYWRDDERGPGYESGPAVRRMQVEKVAKVEKMFRSPGRILDVGCGAGEFLAEMKGRGWETVGIEYAPVTSEFARRRFGLKVVTGELDEKHFADGCFDCVTFWSVLEHVHDPGKVLKIVRRILKPEGRLLVQLPNRASLQAKLFREVWFHLNVPRHLFHFSPRSLGLLLAQERFLVEKWDFFSRTQDHLAYGFGLKRWVQGRRTDAVAREVEPSTAVGRARLSRLKQGVNAALDHGFKPLAFLEAAVGRGGVMTVYARPDARGRRTA